jgi:tRNA G18 (ribose-2'-O)-methylase SpoU
LEPIERAANRTAAQIELGVRQIRADRAAFYLRNTDKPIVQQQDLDNEDGDQSNSVSFRNPNQSINPVVVVLDNVRSANNVGSIFRTSETAGVTEVSSYYQSISNKYCAYAHILCCIVDINISR